MTFLCRRRHLSHPPRLKCDWLRGVVTTDNDDLDDHESTSPRVTRGDMLIRTREGAFILIKCAENVARELYSSTDECSSGSSTGCS